MGRATDSEVRAHIAHLYRMHEEEYKRQHPKYPVYNYRPDKSQVVPNINHSSVDALIGKLALGIQRSDVLVFGIDGVVSMLPTYSGVILTRHNIYWTKMYSPFKKSLAIPNISNFSHDHIDDTNNISVISKSNSFFESTALGMSLPSEFVDFLNDVLKYLQENQ